MPVCLNCPATSLTFFAQFLIQYLILNFRRASYCRFMTHQMQNDMKIKILITTTFDEYWASFLLKHWKCFLTIWQFNRISWRFVLQIHVSLIHCNWVRTLSNCFRKFHSNWLVIPQTFCLINLRKRKVPCFRIRADV